MATAGPSNSTNVPITPAQALPTSLVLTPQMMTKFKPAKIFKNAVDPPSPGSASPRAHQYPRQITGMSFDDSGQTIVTAAEDETFRLYSCKNGKHLKTLHSKKYGVDLPRFTHKNTAIVYASTKEDDTIRYHSLHDNKYLQYFKGHKERVISLEVSPVDDGFMSGSIDRTVRLWDLRTPNCRGLLNLPSSPLVAYDSSGVVFAIAINNFSRILLYDMNAFDKEPFLTLVLDDPKLVRVSFPPRPIYMTSLSFSSNGKYLLIGTSGNAHYIMDAFDGRLLARLEGHIGLERVRMDLTPSVNPTKGISAEEVTWSPDSKFVVGGSVDGKICIWDVQNLHELTPADLSDGPKIMPPLTTLEGHTGASRCVRFNPRYALLASAGAELAFWLPDQAGDGAEDVRDLLKKRMLG